MSSTAQILSCCGCGQDTHMGRAVWFYTCVLLAALDGVWRTALYAWRKRAPEDPPKGNHHHRCKSTRSGRLNALGGAATRSSDCATQSHWWLCGGRSASRDGLCARLLHDLSGVLTCRPFSCSCACACVCLISQVAHLEAARLRALAISRGANHSALEASLQGLPIETMADDDESALPRLATRPRSLEVTLNLCVESVEDGVRPWRTESAST